MKTTQNKAVNAYLAILRLSDKVLSGKNAMALFRLKTKLGPQWEFQREEQEKGIKKYNGTQGENGMINFKTAEERNMFDARLNEIAELEVDFDMTPVKLQYTELELSVADIEALSGFVEFIE